MRKQHFLFVYLALVPSLVFGQSLPASDATSEPVAPMLISGLCGDGVLNVDEQCDDGNTSNEDACSSVCLVEACGDGVLQRSNGEQCDDGNPRAGDGCSSACVLEKSHRSARFGFVLSAVVSLAGLPITSVTGSPIPSIISFGIGPSIGRLYIRDYKKAAIYTALRAAMIGVAFGGFAIAENRFISENVGNFVPFDAFPGDGTFLLGGLLLASGVALYPTIAIIDMGGLLVQNAAQRRRLTVLPAPLTFGQGSLGVSLLGSF